MARPNPPHPEEAAEQPSRRRHNARPDEPLTPLWEVFIRARSGLAHRHVGSIHAADAEMALQAARDTYTRRDEGISLWVVPSAAITASDPADEAALFAPAKPYRHPSFYKLPDEVGDM
jgi:ring-1,2-phenylacetyl-CoA epoxidase subunit PaaB